MSTVAEIEAAIEKLPPQQVREVAAWLEQYQAVLGASEALFSFYDDEEEDQEQQAQPQSHAQNAH